MPYTQEKRIISIDTPLGKDFFLLVSFAAHEAVSRLFRVSAELLSERGMVDFKKVVGQKVTISIVRTDGSTRYINGLVSRFALTGRDDRFMHYHMEIVPWLWF